MPSYIKILNSPLSLWHVVDVCHYVAHNVSPNHTRDTRANVFILMAIKWISIAALSVTFKIIDVERNKTVMT